jgi:SAM-dependent methyltransferase
MEKTLSIILISLPQKQILFWKLVVVVVKPFSSLKGKDKTGIDFSPKMIEVAKANYKDVSFFVMDAENITLEKNTMSLFSTTLLAI